MTTPTTLNAAVLTLAKLTWIEDEENATRRTPTMPVGWIGGYNAGLTNDGTYDRDTLWTGYRAGCPDLDGSPVHQRWLRAYAAGERDRAKIDEQARGNVEAQP